MVTSTEGQVRKEIRFAVVMYGGVSLAIYMNGIAQELLRLVRSTAERDDGSPLLTGDQLDGTEGVYRRLGQILGGDGEGEESRSSGDDPIPIRTRFVIDVLSGTSAGGINAVFLAKALANGQDMGRLKELWVSEGDIEKLLNDEKSAGWGPPAQEPPRSLLSSQRMFYKLVDAFDGMESTGVDDSGDARTGHSEPDTRSPYVRELDLYVTATDLQGLPVTLRLADRVVEERRHRNVFHFGYGEGEDGRVLRNDFHARNNAFLAFTSRCTSAFPFAFEPMRLSDMDQVLRFVDREWHHGAGIRDPERWREFFPGYSDGEGRDYDVFHRAFADGGYLDNKPFGYATDVLSRRSAGIPVDRKLLYIEPNPEAVSGWSGAEAPPDAIENTVGAFTLARYETIREDLERVVARNRLIERVNTLVEGLEEDVRIGEFGGYKTRETYASLYLDDIIDEPGMGIPYGGYHRLKVGAVTDDLARMVTCAADLDPDSDDFLAIRHLVRAWRNEHFERHRSDDGRRRSENAFLIEYDLLYRLRRLNFLLRKMERARVHPDPSVGDPDAFAEALGKLRENLVQPFVDLRRAREALTSRGADNPLHGPVTRFIQEAGPGRAALQAIIGGHSDDAYRERATSAYQKARPAFEKLAARIATRIGQVTVHASRTCRAVLGEPDSPSGAPSPPLTDAGEALTFARHYYYDFERYDLVTFPVYQTAGIGQEIDPVEVLRISPEDATALLGPEKSNARTKLAGTALMNFGAFLDRGWRVNDLLWGRLDGAERIIAALLPEDERTRDQLIQEAHRAIIAEELDLASHEVGTEMSRALLGRQPARSPEEPFYDQLRRHAARGKNYEEALCRIFRTRYVDSVDRSVDPETAARTMARSTRVTGRMLESMAESRGVSRKPGAWVAKLGTVFWRFVEVAAPDGLLNLLFRHWLTLVYLAELILVVGGILLVMPDVQTFGLIALGLTLLVHLVTSILGRWMGGRLRAGWLRKGVRAVAALVAAAIVALATVGALEVFERIGGLFG